MRVYEFAKQHDVSSKELLGFLQGEGLGVKSHMSVLSDEALAVLSNKFAKKKAQSEPAKKPEAKKTKATQESKTSSGGDKEVEESKTMQQQRVTSPKASSLGKAVDPEVEKVSAVSSIVVEPMTPGDFAEKTNIPATEVILTLLKKGKPCAKNNLLSEGVVSLLAKHYEIKELKPSGGAVKAASAGPLVEKNAQGRAPVIVVMGHVDHGKTTLLDYIRKSRVAAKEKGGITQHLGAYQVKTGQGEEIVFLDTPGHEAFSKIRKRGASVADIAILVVAADDGIMPQTLESLRAAKALDLPIIVAVNKVDRVEATRLEIVKQQLTQHDLVPEEWGGSTICVPVSAKEGTGVEELLEMIQLQSEMMELKAAQDVPAQGYVLESKMQKGRGAVATVLCRQGTLRVGDYFEAGTVVGRVTSLTNSYSKPLKEVLPSVPVMVTGFPALANVGSLFTVIAESEYRKKRSGKEVSQAAVLRHMLSASGDDDQKFNLILKADTNSSLEAIIDAIKKFDKKLVKQIVLVRAGIGDVSESDTLLAEDTESMIIGFHVKTENNALVVSRRTQVKINLFTVIYKLLEELESFAQKEKVIRMKLTKIGEAEVLKVFDIKKFGVIAGCIVKDGIFSAKGSVKVLRGRKDAGGGKIKTLQRDKKVVKEVHAGFECAFLVDNFEDWKVGDLVECYKEIPISE